MRYFFWTMLVLFFSCSIFAQQKTSVDYCDYEMGDTTVTFVVENSLSNKDILFINVHENEATSIEALNQFDVKNEYKFFWLNHNATRRIFYNHKAELFSVDPNRIFSHEGIVATLAYDSIFDNRKAEKMAKALAHEILKFVHDAKWIISLHNNTPDNYSIKSYLPGGDEAPNTKDVFINDSMDADDFIYTTNQFLFDELKKKNINAILQDNVNCINDGSLSVYCGMKGIPYANVEAEDGHLAEQIVLIKEVVSIVEGRATSQ
jgi:hypothetical protein